ncbi:MAG: glycosyltransferase family 2 protein [Candidatus Krumholzibacteria bacterium]|nr:glycosyltransferase family 2 protein [Candidatus Krumholzibacteria bacterium]
MSRPMVSVVLPTYNRAGRLTEAMQSVLNQSYPRIELIVVDDGSNDGTPQVVSTFGDPRVRYTAHTVNRGASAARNTGIRIAQGEYLAFQDSDDAWRQDKLSVQIGAMQRAGTAVCVCSHRLIDDCKVSEVTRSEGRWSGKDVIRYLLRGSSISTQTIVARTDAIRDAGGFDESLVVSEDYELCLRLALRHDFVFVARTLVDINRSQDSISGDARRFAEAIERIVSKHAKVFADDRRGYSLQMFKAGKYFAYSDSRKDSLHYVSRALKANPLNGKAIVLLISLLTRTSPILRKIRP